MEFEVVELMKDMLVKNVIDKFEYFCMVEIENWCVNIIVNLWYVFDDEYFMGIFMIGFFEVCMLGGLVMKFVWCKCV